MVGASSGFFATIIDKIVAWYTDPVLIVAGIIFGIFLLVMTRGKKP